MEKKNQDFSMEEVMRLAKSPAGKQLLSMLQQGDSARLQQAVTQAKTGDYTQASRTLSDMLSSPEAQKLLKELGGK
ncbi:MAG: hypothetical protein IKB80_02095 [Oscillospiraceae bacterium]|nr:hypothetical protein [Oscillospiraceae bacterium]